MTISSWFRERSASPIEVFFLSIVMFCLPLFEAPKNIFTVAFIITWSIRSARQKVVGCSSNFDWTILGLMLVLWISPVFSEFNDLVGVLDSGSRWSLLALCVLLATRSNYTDNQLLVIWIVQMVGGVFAVGESLYVWQFNGAVYPEFRSVGHINHSVMYSLVTLACGIGIIGSNKTFLKIIGGLAVVSTLVLLGPSRSFVGFISVFVMLCFCIWVYKEQFKSFSKINYFSSIGLFLIFVIYIFENYKSELFYIIMSGEIFSHRDGILMSALAVFNQYPIIGTGWSTFGLATSESSVRAALDAVGLRYDANVYFHTSHGHNLWVTMLIERGLVGVTLVTVLLFLYVKNFVKILFHSPPVDDLSRRVAVSGFFVTLGFIIAGLGNTTMMNEHGHAGMLFNAVAYGYLRGRGCFRNNCKIP